MSTAVLIAIAMSVGTAEATAQASKWLLCMQTCNEALDAREPAYADWRRWKEKTEQKMRSIRDATRPDGPAPLQPPPVESEKHGDGGRAFVRFKTCNALCR